MMAEHVSRTALIAIKVDSLVFIIPSLGYRSLKEKGAAGPFYQLLNKDVVDVEVEYILFCPLLSLCQPPRADK
jgi:hypothetical protein